MKESGMGRTRLGRFAAVTVPATIASVGFGVAILQGGVSAALSSSEPFAVTAGAGTGSGVELSLRAAQAATSPSSATVDNDNESAFVTLKNGQITDGVCLAANQATGLPGLSTIGFKVTLPSAAKIDLGANTDLNASALGTDAVLGSTQVGIAQDALAYQKGKGVNELAGGFALTSGDSTAPTQTARDARTTPVVLDMINASLYQVTVGGLNVDTIGIAITPSSATCTALGTHKP